MRHICGSRATMTYWMLFSEKSQKAAEALVDEIQQWIVDFEEANPGQPNLDADGWVEDPESWVDEVEHASSLAKPIQARLKKCKSVVIFENPGNPKHNPGLLVVMNRYFSMLGKGVMNWGTTDFDWPSIQLTEEAQASLARLFGDDDGDEGATPAISEPEKVVEEAKESEASYEQIITLLESASRSRGKAMEMRVFMSKCPQEDQQFMKELVQYGYADEKAMAKRQSCTVKQLRLRAANLADKMFALLNE